MIRSPSPIKAATKAVLGAELSISETRRAGTNGLRNPEDVAVAAVSAYLGRALDLARAADDRDAVTSIQSILHGLANDD